MSPQPNISSVAALMADPARATMLMILSERLALPAGELARAAGITAQTASTHLAKLVAGGLLCCEQQGRHRYYRLGGPQVAHAIEHLAAISPIAAAVSATPSPEGRSLRFARCCYDHLAGQVAIAVTRALQRQRYIRATVDDRYEVSAAGTVWFSTLGLDLTALKPTRHGLARQCLDWTEHQHHLAGPLGAGLMEQLCTKGWLRRSRSSRAVQVTPQGWIGLKRQLGVDREAVALVV